jgi:hypothetical protein
MDEQSEELVEQIIVEHIKEGFKTFGIEGTEDVFRRAYSTTPQLLDRYQGVYDRLIGRRLK